jgi:hypothetical protein
MKKTRVIPGPLAVAALTLTILVSVACEPPFPTADVQTLPTRSPTLPSDTPTLEPALPRLPERVPTLESNPVTEIPQDLLDAILDDAQARSGIERDGLTIIKAEAVVWNDGSLGCPQPDQFYTQALVEGYQVVIGHDSQEYDYRASDRGFFFLCEQHLLQRDGTPEGDTGKVPDQ